MKTRYEQEEHGDKGRPRNGNPRFYQLLDEMAVTHDKKSHDYASNTNPSGNYHFAGQVANLFKHSPEDAGFVGRIAEKLYRIANLEGAGKNAQNETIEDTERDIAVITLLWIADRQERRTKPNPLETELFDLIRIMPDFQQNKITNYINELQNLRGSGVTSEAPQTSEAPPDYVTALQLMFAINELCLKYLKAPAPNFK